MFLNRLTLLEKETFISLGVRAAEANGIIVEEEYLALEEYCKEMGIAFFDVRNLRDMEYIVSVFSKSEKSHKRIVLLELLGLMHIDKSYDEQEKEFVEKFANNIGLDSSEVSAQEKLIKKYLELIREISSEIEK